MLNPKSYRIELLTHMPVTTDFNSALSNEKSNILFLKKHYKFSAILKVAGVLKVMKENHLDSKEVTVIKY